MPRYHLELTTNERMLLIFALGCCPQHAVISDHADPPAVPIELARRLVDLSNGNPQTNSTSKAPTSSGVTPAPVQPGDPEVFPLTMAPTSIVKQGAGDRERLVIEWKDRGQVKRASCWVSQKAIWPRVLERVKQTTTFLAKENKGYVNIVGVQS